MVKINKVYTKKGDQGTTTILGPKRISKCVVHIRALGALDELNAFLGWVFVVLNKELSDFLVARLDTIQNQLFDIGAYVCNPSTTYPSELTNTVSDFEHDIDYMNEQLPTLNSFVLPGGCEEAARLHMARTVCRRAEIELVAMLKEQPLIENTIPYLNRLSDWLFVAARYINKLSDRKEQLWNPYSQSC